MAEHWKADDVLHEKGGELVIAGGDGDGPAESSGSRVCVCSSKSSLMAQDDHDEAESSLVVADPTMKSSSLADHQLDRLAPLLANLSVRTGLSKYYQGKSQSFTNLSLVRSLEDLPKKTTTYSTRMKACRGPCRARSQPFVNITPSSSAVQQNYKEAEDDTEAFIPPSSSRNKKPSAYRGNEEYMSYLYIRLLSQMQCR